jgi:hypothetical protein
MEVLDKAPKGFYFSGNQIKDWPQGSFWPGKGHEKAIRWPIGTFADKMRSVECQPWDKNLCPFEGLSESLKCPSGYVCDSLSLHYPHKPCTPGNYCPSGIGNYDKINPSVESPISWVEQSYWKAGAKSGVVLEGNSTSAQICKRGFVWPKRSTSAYGIGECPTGHYCPTVGHPGIPCPPRTYCTGRGNLHPRECPKGTFNYHYGQSNWTACPIGYICPISGLFSPVRCPRGMTWSKEGLVYPDKLCPSGLMWNGFVKSGVQLSKRSWKMLENVEDTFTECQGGIVYYKSGNHFGPQLDGYGFNVTDFVCCWGNSQVREYISNIGRMMFNNLRVIGKPKI